MVTAKESQQLPAWNSPDLNRLVLLQPEQNNSMPYSTPSMHTSNLAFPGLTNSSSSGLITGQSNALLGNFKFPPPYQNVPCPIGNPCLKTSQCALPHGLGVSDVPMNCETRKRFLIFDHSENQTRLFVSSSLCPQNHIIAPKIPASVNGPCKDVASQVDQHFLVKPFVEEKWDENHLNDGEGEMVEDTEEINALLYSDSDDEYDDYDNDTDGENDEVTSTRHSLFSIENCYNKDKLLEEDVMDEVASSDGSPKRQKLLDSSYKKSSLASVESPVNKATPCNDEDDVESHYGEARTFHDGLGSSKLGKKVKIQEALMILGNIIPGLKSKDPLSIIEKAILYLETMKDEAKALGLSFPEHESSAFP